MLGATIRVSVVCASAPRYFGIMMRTSWPSPVSARGSAPATSASPPVLAKGATSEAMRTMRSRFGTLGLLFQDRVHQRGNVRGDPLEVGRHVQVGLSGLEGLCGLAAEPGRVGGR